ncbi:MAG: recombinase family protein [Anaerorhabdus sp.]
MIRNNTNSKITDSSDERNIAIYCRVSTRDQAEFGYSVRDQESKIGKYLDYIEDIPDKCRALYKDEGQSAKNLKRKEFTRLMDDIKKNQIKAVIIHNMDWLTRRMKDFIELIELFEKHDVELISLREKIETNSAMGRFLVNFIVLIAQWERETISERTIRGLDRSAIEGNYSVGGNRLPYGYKKKNKKLIIDEKEANIVQWIFNSIENSRYNLTIIAYDLNKRKVKSSSWEKWTDSIVKSILTNSIYYGTFKNSRISLSNHSPAIVSADQFYRVQDILKKRSRTPKHFYTFASLLICGECGEHLVVESAQSKGRTYLYYRCRKCKKRISEKKLNNSISSDLAKIYSENSPELKSFLRKEKRIHLQNKTIHLFNGNIEDCSSSLFNVEELDSIKSHCLNNWTKFTPYEKRSALLKIIKSIQITDFDTIQCIIT